MENGAVNRGIGSEELVVVNPELMDFDPSDYPDVMDEINGDVGEEDYREDDHIVVKSEIIDQLDYSNIEEEGAEDMNYGYLPNDYQPEQTDDGSAGAEYVREMVLATPEQRKLRKKARDENMVPRTDCPVCGDRVNGIHYGIYTCEGCKNFFKRSMGIKRPYVCNNQNDCDIGVFLDTSGFKRKGTRCQACRFTGCLEAGMIHQGHNRSTGKVRRSTKLPSPGPGRPAKLAKLLPKITNVGSNCYVDNATNISESHHSKEKSPEEKSILESMLEAPKLASEIKSSSSTSSFKNKKLDKEKLMNGNFPMVSITSVSSMASDSGPTEAQLRLGLLEPDQELNQLMKEQNRSALEIVTAQLSTERAKSSELQRQVRQKEDVIASLEIHLSLMEKHMILSQALTNKQKAEINKLTREVKRLGQFSSIIQRNKPVRPHPVNGHAAGTSGSGTSSNWTALSREQEIDPLDLLEQSSGDAHPNVETAAAVAAAAADDCEILETEIKTEPHS